jgi:TIR domain/Pentapeptide repeats (8 copies)
MPNTNYLKIIEKGSEAWNTWREENLDPHPDLSGADLSGADLHGADLSGVDLSRATLREAKLSGADLSASDLNSADFIRADLSFADLSDSNLIRADLSRADFCRANLTLADLTEANLSGANLSNANLQWADLSWLVLSFADLSNADLRFAILDGADLRGANLREANLSRARVGWTTFGDLSTVTGLESLIHRGPSIIGIDTLFKSNGKIPHSFLREVGVSEDFITFIPSLVGCAIEFYSCFISYSHQDEEFSKRLHSRMRREDLRVWYAPEDIKGGRKLHEEIFSAIQIHDKLLLVLSEHSMRSEWVMTEIRRARKVEREENRRKLFPIRLVEFDTLQKWECFDADSGKDLAVDVREYYIPDFSNWKDDDAFEREFAKLLRDLQATKG